MVFMYCFIKCIRVVYFTWGEPFPGGIKQKMETPTEVWLVALSQQPSDWSVGHRVGQGDVPPLPLKPLLRHRAVLDGHRGVMLT